MYAPIDLSDLMLEASAFDLATDSRSAN